MNEVRLKLRHILLVIGVLWLETWWIVKSVASSIGQ